MAQDNNTILQNRITQEDLLDAADATREGMRGEAAAWAEKIAEIAGTNMIDLMATIGL